MQKSAHTPILPCPQFAQADSGEVGPTCQMPCRSVQLPVLALRPHRLWD